MANATGNFRAISQTWYASYSISSCPLCFFDTQGPTSKALMWPNWNYQLSKKKNHRNRFINPKFLIYKKNTDQLRTFLFFKSVNENRSTMNAWWIGSYFNLWDKFWIKTDFMTPTLNSYVLVKFQSFVCYRPATFVAGWTRANTMLPINFATKLSLWYIDDFILSKP